MVGEFSPLAFKVIIEGMDLLFFFSWLRVGKWQDLGVAMMKIIKRGKVTEFHKMALVLIWLSLVGPTWSQGPKIKTLEGTDMNIQS